VYLAPADEEACALGSPQEQAVGSNHLGVVQGLAGGETSGTGYLHHLCHRVEAHHHRLGQQGLAARVARQPRSFARHILACDGRNINVVVWIEYERWVWIRILEAIER